MSEQNNTTDQSKEEVSNLEGNSFNFDSKEIELESKHFVEQVNPSDMLKFAKQILLGVVLIFLFSACVYIWPFEDESNNSAAKDLFDFAKSSLLPIVTLILGYYFANEKK